MINWEMGVAEHEAGVQSGEDGERRRAGEEDKKPHLLESRIQELHLNTMLTVGCVCVQEIELSSYQRKKKTLIFTVDQRLMDKN